MHPGRWFNETAFDSVDYLVPALLLFVLAAAKWAWRYWHRETLRARRIVLSLLTIGAGCLLLWVVLGRAELPPGSTFTPAWSSCPQWTVRVEGAPGALSEADVAKWFELLRDAPSDGRWKLRGIGLTEPAPEPAP